MAPTEKALEPGLGPWHLLGYTLRILRHEHGESLTDTAKHFPVSRQTVSHWETAYVHMGLKYCRKLDERWNTGGLLETLHHIAKQGRQANWFGTFGRIEQEADGLKIFAALWVPGLLQTEAYARASFQVIDAANVEEGLALRRERQKRLTGDNPPRVWVVLDQGVLERPVGGPKVMREQIQHLLALGEMSQISLRVVPTSTGGYRGLDGSFHLMTGRGRTVAYVEAPGSWRLVQGSDEVENFAIRWEDISAHALPWDASRDILIKLMERYS